MSPCWRTQDKCQKVFSDGYARTGALPSPTLLVQWNRDGNPGSHMSFKSHWIWGRASTPVWVLGQVLGGEGFGWVECVEHPVLGWRGSLLSKWAVVPPGHVPVPRLLAGDTKLGQGSCRMDWE